jgi:hypothetical protein
MLNYLKNNRGEGYIDVVVVVISGIMVLAMAVNLFPVLIAKVNMNTFAQELCREAEISGVIGTQTTNRQRILTERLEIDPDVRWSKTGNIQLDEEFTVTVSKEFDIGFGGFGSFPVILISKATGKSEVYHK